jgi:hypothetical protein
MLIGLVLIGADQLGWLPGRGSASSDQQADAAANPEKEYALAKGPTAGGAAASQQQTVPVAQRLRQAATTNANKAVHDAFAPGSAWIVVGDSVRVDNSGLAGQFQAAHRLTGVLTSGGRAHAMVDAKIVAIGQSIDGFKLISLSGRSATFESADQGVGTVVLNMTERATAAPPNTTAGVAP